jgi:hypothetical protein
MITYNVGNSTKQIKLTVEIDTVGLAASRASLLDLNSTDPSTSVAHSGNATGDIPQTNIGQANKIKNMQLSVLTKIDLIGDLDFRKKESARITGSYELENGQEGHMIFGEPEKVVSDDFVTVFLLMEINLTA